MMKPSQVLIKIYANQMPRACTSYSQWDGPKVFEERLVTPDEAEKLKDKWVHLSEFMKEKDFEKNLDEGFDGGDWKILEANMCQRCKKYNHACAECLYSAFGRDGYEHTMAGDCIDLLPNYPPCSDSLHIFPLVYYNAMKFEIITDARIIEAFKIVNPNGYVRSYPILDEIDRCFQQQGKSSSSTIDNDESSSSIAEIHVEYYPDILHKLHNIYRGPTGVIYFNIAGRLTVIGFDSENDRKIKIPTASQKSHLREDVPLNLKWRNGNNNPVSCDEYLKIISSSGFKCSGSPAVSEEHLYYYPNPTHKTHPLYRDNSGVIYAAINGRNIAIGFDVEKDGKIKMSTSFQKSLLRKDVLLNIKWRNGNNNPVSCDEYLKMTSSRESSSSLTSDSESSEIHVHYYPDPPHESLSFYRTNKGIIYTTINNQPTAIGFDVVNNGKIKMPTVSQISLLRKDKPLNLKWRNGNHKPMSCEEYLKITKE